MPNRPAASELDHAVDDLTTAVGQLLRRLRAEVDADELNLSQLCVISRLDKDGPSTTADLARAEGMKPQSMGTILAALEQRKLVKRQPHPSDGRQMLVALTAAGVESRRKRGVAKRAWLRASMDALTPAEQTVLIAAIPLIKRLGGA